MTESIPAELFWLTLTALLTSILWAPYILERMLRLGPIKALGFAGPGGITTFNQPSENAAGWAVRVHAAHKNGVENLVVFSTLVLTAYALDVPAATAAQVYFFARLAHLVIYAAGIPVLRTLTYLAGFVAQTAIGLAILGIL